MRAGSSPRGVATAAAAVTVLLSLLLGLGCASGPRAEGAGAGAASARLIVRSEVPDAVVWVDDRMIGEIAQLSGGLRLRPGLHRIELRHDRYHTRYLEVELARGEERTVDVPLAEVLD